MYLCLHANFFLIVLQGTAIDLFDRYQDVEDFVLKGKSDCSIFEAKILNDRQIVTSHDDGSLRVWDSKTGI